MFYLIVLYTVLSLVLAAYKLESEVLYSKDVNAGIGDFEVATAYFASFVLIFPLAYPMYKAMRAIYERYHA